jgi:hypothetical protein
MNDRSRTTFAGQTPKRVSFDTGTSEFSGETTPLASRSRYDDAMNDRSRTTFAGQTPKRVSLGTGGASEFRYTAVVEQSPVQLHSDAPMSKTAPATPPVELVVVATRTSDLSGLSKKRKAGHDINDGEQNYTHKKMQKKDLWGYSYSNEDNGRSSRDIDIRNGTFYSYMEREINRKMRSMKRDRSEGSGYVSLFWGGGICV